MASVAVALTNASVDSGQISWTDDVSLGTVFSLSGSEQTLDILRLWYEGTAAGQVQIFLLGDNERFTTAFEATGRFILTASDGETLEVIGVGGDMSEPYQWRPTNSDEIIAFASHVVGLTDRNATLTLTDDPVSPTTIDHAVDAVSASWVFDLPEPEVTHTAHVPTDHAVDASAASWVFNLPEPTVTHTPAPGFHYYLQTSTIQV